LLLTCPTCRSGLQVPDGTTAMVRCPACKAIFSSAAGLIPTQPVEEEEGEDARERQKARRKLDHVKRSKEDELEKPRKKRLVMEVEEESDSARKNRDFDPLDPTEKPKPRRQREDDSMSPEERAALKQAFTRAAWGCKLIWISIILFMVSMLMIIGYWFEAVLTSQGVGSPVFLVLAGVIGLVNWLMAAVGVGLCLSGPTSQGHWGYGISASVATGLHLVLLLILFSQGKDYSAGRTGEAQELKDAARWALLPTRLDALTIYLVFVIYPDQELIPKVSIGFSIVVGIVEMARIILIMMLLSCLAQAAGDKELSHSCTRAGGTACFGPGMLAIAILLYVVVVVETNAQSGTFARIVFMTVRMGVYAILAGTMFRAMMVTHDVAETCEEPFQSELPKL
jgi:LSD1 subclass zinc finger protein